MPLYDIECGACGHGYEEFQTMDAKQPTRCQKCAKRKARHVLLKPCATYNTYSPCHPRKKRGTGIGRKGL
jgi:putative FmdB family regulatory protein